MRQHVIDVALKIIQERGLINLSRFELCKHAGIPDGSFHHVMDCTFIEFIKEMRVLVNETTKIHKVTKTRTDPELRRDQILNVAIEMAKTDGYNNITRDELAIQAGISAGLVSNYFNTMKQLRRAIIRAAIKQEIIEIVAQGIGCADIHAKKAPPELKAKAAKLIAEY